MQIRDLFSRISSLLKFHKHNWQEIAGSENELDQGIGMAPAKTIDLTCAECGAKAIKTLHPVYGNSIVIAN